MLLFVVSLKYTLSVCYPALNIVIVMLILTKII